MKKNIFDYGMKIDKNNWFEVFSASLGKVIASQNKCGELVVKGQNWNVDLSAGTLSFGSNNYPVQFIGSESASSNTWLWGWENINSFPDKILTVAHEMKRIGLTYGLEPLKTAEFSLTDTFSGHTLSIVACALYNKNICYYRGPHSGGAVLMAFSELPEEVFEPLSAQEFVSISMQCIQQFYIEHGIFVTGFLYQNNTPFECQDNKIIAHFDTDLYIEFDELGRIKNMATE